MLCWTAKALLATGALMAPTLRQAMPLCAALLLTQAATTAIGARMARSPLGTVAHLSVALLRIRVRTTATGVRMATTSTEVGQRATFPGARSVF